MPTKKTTTTTKTTTKRKPKAKAKQVLSNSKSLTMIAKTPFLGEKHWANNMPYHEAFLLDASPTPETLSAIGFTLNGLFDPEVALGGHQPMGFDQAMTFYEHYTVTEVSWTLIFNTADAAVPADTTFAVGYFISPEPLPPLGADQIVENGLMKRAIVTCNPNNSRCQTSISGKLDMAKYFGKKIINEDDYRGDVGANPIEQVYLYTFIHPLTAAQPCRSEIDLTMNYKVLFSEPRKVAKS